MENIRCVVAGFPHKILADIIHQIIDANPDFEVVYRTEDIDSISEVVKNNQVDVAILGTDKILESKMINKLFALSPHTVAVAIVNDGRRVFICSENTGLGQIIDIMKAVVNQE